MEEIIVEDRRTQVFMVHGGMTFKHRDEYIAYLKTRTVSIKESVSWSGQYFKDALQEECHVIKPRMPLQDFAQYDEWKIHFERFFPLLKDDLILIGSSLGGIFLAKYLSENRFPKRLLAVYLVCPPFDDSLSTEDLEGGFVLGDDLSLIEENCDHTTLLFSRDDDVVPVCHAEKYGEKLKRSRIIVYESMNGHFLVSEFSELVAMVREDLKRL